jgi:serine phosphatase RsbU (regulator of sigma subunit)/anti-sigma regulatory factor (Ser/Thr protein kinase)
MMSRSRRQVLRGSWRWAVHIAELSAWGTAALVLFVLHIANLRSSTYRVGLVLVSALAVWLVVLFRGLLVRFGSDPRIAWLALVVNLGFACSIFAVFRRDLPVDVPSELIFVPVIMGSGLLGRLPEALATVVLAVAGYWGVAVLTGPAPAALPGTFATGVFVLAGSVAGLLARELRSHYRAEQEEHRLATAVRHRLMAVLDAVGEAIVFSDRQGVVRVVNSRAGEIFEIDPDAHLGLPVVQLLRAMARKTEDPEGFMETFQQLRDDPELELQVGVEQILPERRQLRLYSAPARDEDGSLVGRIDVYADITESVRRAAEVEELYEQARKTAESYQRGLLPDSVPTLPRVAFVAHYVPAAGQRAVCGDFYDFISMPDGKIGIVLGDVCGVGPQAANDAALTRYTLRSFASDDQDPARLMERMNAHVYSHLSSERFVRLLLGVLDPERAVVEYANAGHVPPVVHHFRNEEVEWLGEGGIALGIEEDARYKVGRVELDPGDLLVLYTDGVTEAARNGRPLGQGKFSDLVSQYGAGTPGELVQAIGRAVDAWVGTAELRDDLALLVCQVAPDTAIGEPVRELVLPNQPARVGDVRAFVGAFLADVRAPVDVTSEILIAVNEAAANAARHARREDGRSEIRVRCALAGPNVVVTVADDGPGFDASSLDSYALPDRFASGGRGLFLMRQLMDAVDFDASERGTTVTLIRWVFGAPRA